MVAAAICTSLAGPLQGALVLNEVLYDPEGPDSGSEWVELFNTGPWAATLEGVRIESGNGSGPGQWKPVWSGREGDWIEAGGFFRIGGAYAGQEADAGAELDLQNGPDGVRLIREGLELDRVGWGSLTEPEYFEGTPVPAASSGWSIARRVDGADTGDNEADFEPARPTPRRENHPRTNAAVRLCRGGRGLPCPSLRGALTAELAIENRGRDSLPVGSMTAAVDGAAVSFGGASVSAAGPAASPAGALIPPGGIFRFPVDLPIRDAGTAAWVACLRADHDLVPEDDCDTLRLRVGPPPVRLSELAPRPLAGGSEWIELETSEGLSIPLEGWSVSDRSGSRIRLEPGRSIPGRRAVLARDSSRAGEISGAFLPWTGSWPVLNDTPGEDGSADSLFLWDPSGMMVDWAAYGATPAGGIWVRLQGADPGPQGWVLANGGGTPGSANPSWSAAEPAEEGLAPGAVSLGHDPGGAWVRLDASLFPGSWQVRIVDLDGREVWNAAGTARDRVECRTRWDGRAGRGGSCPGGVYVLLARVLSEGGGDRTFRQALVLGR